MKGSTGEIHIEKTVDKGTRMDTDASGSYTTLERHDRQALHEPVVMKDTYKVGKVLFWVHIAISNANMIILDTYYDIKTEFMQLYLNEFCYKFNRRFPGFHLFDRQELCACNHQTDFKHECINGSMRKFILSNVSGPIFSLLLIALILLMPMKVEAIYDFHHIDMNNGLSHNAVMSIAQDKTGFMWFGTRKGLNRFDGMSVKSYTKGSTQGLGNDNIQTIYVAANNHIWVGTENGVFIYDPITDSFVRFRQMSNLGSFVSGRINLIAGEGRYIFISTVKDGLFRYDQRKKKLVNFYNVPGPVLSMCFSGNFVYVGFYGAGLQVTKDFKKFYPFTNKFGLQPFQNQNITGVVKMPDGNYYIGSDKLGLLELNTSEHSLTHLINVPNSEGLIVHQIGRIGRKVCAATEGGLYVYDTYTCQLEHYFHDSTNPFSLSDNPLQCVYEDRNFGLWLGSYFGGVNYVSFQALDFKKFFPQLNVYNTLHGRRVKSFQEDLFGRIWIGTEDGGLNCYNPSTGHIGFVKASARFPNIQCLCMDGSLLWIGTYSNGLKILDTKTDNVVKSYGVSNKPGSLKDNSIFSIYRTRSGSMYLGTLSGLFEYYPRQNTFLSVKGLSPNIIYCIYEDKFGDLWVDVNNIGLYMRRAHSNSWVLYSESSKGNRHISSNNVLSMFEDHSGRLWMSTEDGNLENFDRNIMSFRSYKSFKNKYLRNRVVYQIQEDQKGNFWMSTSNGLICYSPKGRSFRVYTTNNGLLSNNFSYFSSFISRKGDLYFGDTEGFVAFNPSFNFFDHKSFANIVATDFLINGINVGNESSHSLLPNSITYTRKLVLDYNENSFSIKIALLGFNDLAANLLEYKLEGFDKNWQTFDDNKGGYIKYTNLPAGLYKLRVRARDINGKSVCKDYILDIMVKSPLYLRWWALFLYIAVFIMVVYLGWHYYDQRAKARQRILLEKANYEKDQELYQSKINFFTNIAHEIRTPLTLIKGPLEDIMHHKNSNEERKVNFNIMSQNVNRLTNLINQLLDFRKAERNGLKLNISQYNINKIFHDVYVRFTPVISRKGIVADVQLPSPDLLAYVDKEAVTKIFSNLLSNAVKYCKNVLKVHLYHEDALFYLEICNDGPLIPESMRKNIFKPFVRVESSKYQTGSGIGLTLARTLAALHGGNLTFDVVNDFNVFSMTMPIYHKPSLEFNQLDQDGLKLQTELPIETVSDSAESSDFTVLVVEDNIQMRQYEMYALSRKYKVLSAADGTEALSVLQKNQVDIIVSDAMMEPMDGFQLCSQVKKNVDYSHIPFILLTALTLDSAKAKGLECSADSYIEKPFSMDYLINLKSATF
jgi:signal transduction histidine kinase/ligand-binding sensor domain-containing protein/CheY-like chemotaxis protein